MKTRILATKLHIPLLRPSMVPRPRLQEHLTLGLQENHKLTLVSAPAGYGKTALITEWLHSRLGSDLSAAWLSLDPADNDPLRFFSYWISAFQQVNPAFDGGLPSLLDLPKLPPAPSLLDELLNELVSFESSLVLILEDYHLITNPVIHEALEYFLDHQPAQVHLVLITRQDPPLPLPRFRARGQMTEVRASELRFTPEEARQFFAQSMKLDLAEESVALLDERTEGWAVGLQLAGLALKNLTDPQKFIETFRGSHRFVLDYLAEEVIRQQGHELRAFLTQTSILERFNADLCCALTGREDAPAVIAYLEKANLFIVSLDNERVWYRYHHLFSDYLRILLSRTEQVELYKKASAWNEANELIEEAVAYALLSGDMEFAAEVVTRALISNTTWSTGNVTVLSAWLEALPEQVFHNRPQLSLNASRVAYLAGQFEVAEKYIQWTEEALLPLQTAPLQTAPLPQPPEVEQMLALAALYRGAIASVRRDVQQAFEKISFAQARIPAENHLAHARGFFSLGLAYEISDQTEQAVQHYLRSSEEAQQADVLFLAVHALCAAAQVQIKQGHLTQAAQSCQTAIQLTGGAVIPPLGLAWIILGSIALEHNDLAAAEQLLQEGIALARRGGLMDDVILGLYALARLHAVRGNASPINALHQEASALIKRIDVQPMILQAGAYQARLQFYTGQQQAALQWADAYRAMRDQFADEFSDLTLARILLAVADVEGLPAILHPLLEKANQAGRMQTCIEVLLLLALYHQAKQDPKSAREALGKSLQLAAPEGYARIYLDEGKPLLDLLPAARPFAPGLVDALLEMGQQETFSGANHPKTLEQLPEALSEQEMRVLQLIMAGKSNREIAAELFISAGTAKWHVHNILQKLGVHNRPQAIARARKLGL